MADDFKIIDSQALRARYAEERDKRLANLSGYVAPVGEYQAFLSDPFAGEESAQSRAPASVDTDAVLVGAGFANLQTAASLINRGVEDFLLIDRAADFGGVWYWNRYPGVACDVDSYIYMPLLEETGYMPTRKYARGSEVFEYARRVGRHFDLYRRALFRREIVEIRWNAETSRWHIETDHGDRITARFVNLATGPLQRPRLPNIAGIRDFKGRSFHTSRWDFDYTGGDSEGALSKLRDKKVGIIGTGATSVQAVPHLAESAEHLYVFQRTPAPVPVRNHQDTDVKWFKSLEPGWQRERMDNFNILTTGGRQDVDLVADGWTEILHRVGIETDQMADIDADVAERQRLADDMFMSEIRARIDSIVEDKTTAEALKPWYSAGCKRPCFHDEYLATFNRPNVTLVDTQGQGIECVTENAVVVAGRAYQIDCLIYATGFDFNTGDMKMRNGFEVYGEGGRSWTEKWAEEGIRTLHGYTMRGFPNLVVQGNAQGSLAPNVTHALGEGGKHFAYLVATCLDRGITSFQPSAGAEHAYGDRIRHMTYRRKFDAQCTPGYYNNEGKANEVGGIAQFYPGSPHKFFLQMQEWRDAGTMDGMELRYEARVPVGKAN